MTRKSVGIITILKVNNYGAELQAFALQKKIQSLGYNAEIIDYLYYINPNHTKESKFLPKYLYSLPKIKRLKSWLFPKIEALKSLMHISELKRRNIRFRDFHKKNTNLSKTYSSYTDLYSEKPIYDIYCVGSDQVWNPFSFTSLDPYFLTFAENQKVKFSYASSFGVSNIPDDAIEYFCNGLNNLDLISVREKTGAEVVRKLTRRDAMNVVDPTLLLDAPSWEAVSSDACIPYSNYILLYVLKESPYITETAIKFSKETNLPIVRICRGAYRQDKKTSPISNIMDAGPAEFISLFKNATIVLTNSFHGTVFSVLFHRNFYTIISKKSETNSRQIDLLNRIGIDRIRYVEDEFIVGEDIDWGAVDKRIENLRSESINFLERAINYEK